MANREVITDEEQLRVCKETLGLSQTGGEIIPRRVFTTKDIQEGRYEYRQKPTEVVSPSGALLLNDDNYLTTFFTERGLSIRKPLHIINRNVSGTTDFIGAGIQTIEDEIHGVKSHQNEIGFVAQPAFRSQHISRVVEGFSPSFINLATTGANINADSHTELIIMWEKLLISLGLDKNKIEYQENWVKKKWGELLMTGHEVYYCYQGFPLGDASYNIITSGKNRGVRFSDIGFGLERIRWLLQGGNYSNTFSVTNTDYKLDYQSTCILSAMTLLAGSGINPHYQEHGYQLRKMSKRLINNGIVISNTNGTQNAIYDFYDRWSKWTIFEKGASEVYQSIQAEHETNVKKK